MVEFPRDVSSLMEVKSEREKPEETDLYFGYILKEGGSLEICYSLSLASLMGAIGVHSE